MVLNERKSVLNTLLARTSTTRRSLPDLIPVTQTERIFWPFEINRFPEILDPRISWDSRSSDFLRFNEFLVWRSSFGEMNEVQVWFTNGNPLMLCPPSPRSAFYPICDPGIANRDGGARRRYRGGEMMTGHWLVRESCPLPPPRVPLCFLWCDSSHLGPKDS